MKIKLKTRKSAAKRIRVKKNVLRRKKAYKGHLLRKKTTKQLRGLSQAANVAKADIKSFALMLPYG
jgi:large subunit ribosomal protein L35